jgi:hypothetical protein
MQVTPAFRQRVGRVLQDRGANAFVARRFFRLPAAAQLFGLIALESDAERDVRELIGELEEDTERLERSRRGE